MGNELSYHEYSIVLLSLPIGCLLLIIFQFLSSRYTDSFTDKWTKCLLYSIYGLALVCGIIGLSIHHSTHSHWCGIYGIIACFSILGASKACLYLFFLRKAKLAQGMIINKYLNYFFNYLGPLYCLIYWIIYTIATSFVFEYGPVPTDNDNDTLPMSKCYISKYELWFSLFAASVDIFNSFGTLFLFLFPLIKAIKTMKILNQTTSNTLSKTHKTSTATDIVEKDHISVMKWNVILTSIASTSSVITLFSVLFADEENWAFCLGDPFINAFCAYCMIKSNRDFLKRITLCAICRRRKEQHQKPPQIQIVDSASFNKSSVNTPPVNTPSVNKPKQNEKISIDTTIVYNN